MSKPVIVFFALLLAAVAVSHAATITGRVIDETGQPVPNVDLDFTDLATGNDESVNGDTTDVNGMYTVIIDPAFYDVFFTAPPGGRLAGHVEQSVNLNVNQTVNVTLAPAWFISGQVFRADTSGPATGVDLDFENVITGEKIFTPMDNTDLTGTYNVAVPRGIYRVNFDGPEPDLISDPPQLARGELLEVSLDGSADITLPSITLPLGFHVEGQVIDDKGDAVVGADLDFIVSGTNTKAVVRGDNTGAGGVYDTIVPAGTYDIEVDPPPGAPAAAQMLVGVPIAADSVLGTHILEPGLLLFGMVKDPDGNALPRVDLDLRASGLGNDVPTAWDKTDSSGQYFVYVAAGTYDIDFEPLSNTEIDAATRLTETVLFDRGLSDQILPFHDNDNDGFVDVHDDCPFFAGPQVDGDADGAGDPCDNCPATSNPRQEDNDSDGTGDACDADDDNDGTPDSADPDDDGDVVPDGSDNCPNSANPDQADSDGDLTGDACDPDDGEVERLVAWTRSGFTWRAETGALGYRVYRQRLGWMTRINYGVCEHAAGGTVYHDDDLPEPAEAYTYLVTAETATGEGSLGRTDTGLERPNLRSCP